MKFKETVQRYISPDKIASILDSYPSLYHRAKVFYFNDSIFNGKIFKGVRLSCYAKGKCSFESFSALGSGKGEVEIHTLYTALNTGTERAMLYRLPGIRIEFPYIPRASGVGQVVRVGRRVSGLRPGDLVAGPLMHASAQSLPADRLVKLSSDSNLDEVSMLHLCIIAMQGIRMGRVREGQRVVVMGQGIIGRLATLLARAMGAGEVICVTRTTEKLRRLHEQHGIATDELCTHDTMQNLKADVVIDATGNPEAIHTAMVMAREGGKIVLLGSNRGKTISFDVNGLPMAKSLTIVGAHIRNQLSMPPDIGLDYHGEAQFIQELLKEKKLSLEGVITARVPCTGLVDFYPNNLSTDRDSCGIVIDWSESAKLLHIKRQPLECSHAVLPEGIKPLKMALVGCGDIGTKDAEAIAKCKGFDLSLVMDTNLSLAQEVGKRYSTPCTDKYDDIIADKSISAVMIAVPHFLHAPLSIQAAYAGKHILVEKPLAISMEEATSMIKTAQDNKVLLRTFLPFSYEFQKRMAKLLIDHDALGKLMGVSISLLADQPQRYWYGGYRGRSESDWRTRKELSGGGFLIMNLTHVLDYLRSITGIKIKTIFTYYDTLYHPVEVEDIIGLTFRGSQGEIGTVSAGSAVKGQGGDFMRLWGENGQLVMDGNSLKFYSLRPIGEFSPKRWHTIKVKSQEDSRLLFLNDFRQQIEEKHQVNFNDAGYHALRIVMAAYKSGDLGQPVGVDDIL